MKTIALILAMVCLVSCKKETSTKTEEIIPDTKETSSKVETNDTSEDINLGGLMEGFGELLGDSDATDSLKQVLSSTDDKMDLDFLKDLKNGDGEIDTAVWLDLLEKSGVSREEMEKLLNNPDSLDALLTEMKKTRESSASQKDNTSTQTDGSIAGNPGQNAGSGISLEDAIKMVQDESGIDATMAKLKQGDSLAGTNTMSQIPTDPDAINKLPMSNMEQEIIDRIRKMSGNLHSENEAKALVKLIEKEELKSSNNPQATERFKAALKYNRSGAKIHSDDLKRKSKAAKTKFKKLNPDLFYGDDVGVSYVGNLKKTVYLPLGPLSFADEIVKVRHPKLMTNDVKNVLGEPDVVETFDDATGIYSLGLGGTLTIRFTDNALVDVNGPDLYLFEIGQLEPTELEISKDGETWIKVGKIDGGVAEVDIAPFVKQGELYYYVRLKDLKMDSGIPGADVDAIAAIGSAMRLNLDSKVLFDTGKSQLKPEGIEALKELAKSIEVLKRGNVIVEGHTDDVGSTDTNKKLSLARAKSVSAELKKLIPSTNFVWKERGFGEEKPLVKNDSEENKAKNRRVEVLVLPN